MNNKRINWNKVAEKQRHSATALGIIGRTLLSEFEWNGELDGLDEGDSNYFRLWRDDKNLYHSLEVFSAELDADGSGTSFVRVEYGHGIDESLNVEVAIREGKANATELNEGLLRIFGMPHKRFAQEPAERRKVCNHEGLCRWTGQMPRTGRYLCSMCGTDFTESVR